MVIVIIGILAAVVGPRFFDRQQFDQRMFYEESLSAVRYAQKLALASGCLTQVSLSQAAGYQVQSGGQLHVRWLQPGRAGCRWRGAGQQQRAAGGGHYRHQFPRGV